MSTLVEMFFMEPTIFELRPKYGVKEFCHTLNASNWQFRCRHSRATGTKIVFTPAKSSSLQALAQQVTGTPKCDIVLISSYDVVTYADEDKEPDLKSMHIIYYVF